MGNLIDSIKRHKVEWVGVDVVPMYRVREEVEKMFAEFPLIKFGHTKYFLDDLKAMIKCGAKPTFKGETMLEIIEWVARWRLYDD